MRQNKTVSEADSVASLCRREQVHTGQPVTVYDMQSAQFPFFGTNCVEQPSV